MPLEIRELIIKATVGNTNGAAPADTGDNAANNEATVNEVVERVFEILREKSER